MLIRIWVERMEPLAGTAATEEGQPLPFDGWLELLRVVSELVAAAPSSVEDADSAKGGHAGRAGDPAAGRRSRGKPDGLECRTITRRAEPNDQGRMGTMRIGLTSIYVDDQDKAEQFYTQVLGFHVKTSAPYTDTERWLSVVSPEEPDGVELVLHLADEPARAFQQASRQAGRPVLSLRTDDCVGEAERLKAQGVVFVKEPGPMPYGGIDAVVADSCGNLLNLHQD